MVAVATAERVELRRRQLDQYAVGIGTRRSAECRRTTAEQEVRDVFGLLLSASVLIPVGTAGTVLVGRSLDIELALPVFPGVASAVSIGWHGWA